LNGRSWEWLLGHLPVFGVENKLTSFDRFVTDAAGFELVYVDDYIDELLHDERCCDVILPRIQVTYCTSDSLSGYLLHL